MVEGAKGWRFEMEQFLCMHKPSVPNWRWYDDAAHLFTRRSFFFPQIFERVGLRERRVLWDPLGVVQCQLGITY
jgi:hypothetical protein